MAEQLYRFIDKTGHCFESFQIMGVTDFDRRYHDSIGAILRTSNAGKHDFSIGDMFCIRDELQKAGFQWNVDFYIKKITQKS